MDTVAIILILVIGIPLLIGIGFGFNYIVFEGLLLYSSGFQKNKLKKQKENVLWAIAFGVFYVGVCFLLKELNITIKNWDSNIIIVIFFMFIGLLYLLNKSIKDPKERNYWFFSLIIIAFALSIPLSA